MADKITFDGFTRGLGTGGGQAPTLRSVEEADARCEVLCEQRMGLPVFKEDLQTAHGQSPIISASSPHSNHANRMQMHREVAVNVVGLSHRPG